MTKHIEIYDIDWHRLTLRGPIRFDEGTDGYEQMKDCYLHMHSYVMYTEPHEEGECPGRNVSWQIEPLGPIDSWVVTMKALGGTISAVP